MAAAASLTEPTVLAHTKSQLFPEDGSDSYVVADTQFARDQWIEDREIAAEVTSTLAPFNHVRVGSGYPDLIGVRRLEAEYLAVDRLGDEPPLVVVEAKGRKRGGVDVQRGIVQAYDRLGEANVAFVSAPAGATTATDRTLARQLNVGVLGVEADGSIEVLERPRVVGNRTAEEATAIRFQASAQGVADRNFSLNHPKNYLAVPLALAHDRDHRALLDAHVVSAVDGAIDGAAFLGLIDERGASYRLTSLGQEVVRFALREYPALDDALAAFEQWQRSRKRFRDLAPRWGQLARRVVFEYPATELLVTELQTMHDDGLARPSLIDLVTWLHEQHPTFTVELFLRGDEDVRERALTADGELRTPVLEEGASYHSPTVFQLKAMLFHAGILTERGSEPTNLDPRTDEWVLCEPLSRRR
ncbi:hypothetical protein [Halapricum desulfuricans]|uniref:Uncharacterized protein n=1 Tax=Halapricum desulfuricans TaxID=2841257 RepID=A0A897N3L3_9EURY|nr:hypothetical protein [Halapricum desulfuricans]QSG04896.1 Uncharacterized protein HSR121_0541 [Halapricum desulfuricans]